MSRSSVKTASRSARPGSVKAIAAKSSRRAAAKSVAKAQKLARKVSAKSDKPSRATAAAVRALMAAKKTKEPPKTAKIVRTASPPVQPAQPIEILLKHKYQIGEVVYFTSPSFGRAATNGSYTVVKLLPSEGDDYQYRIKSSGEAFERVAKESQLERA